MTTTRTIKAAVLLGIVALWASAAMRGVAVERAAHAKDATDPAASKSKSPPRALIFLWMSGGPSHIDTFDMKPEAPMEIRGPFKPIPTNVPGVQISEHLPKLAKFMDQMVVIRSLTHRESSHDSASFLMHTGRLPSGFIDYPSLPAALAKELSNEQSLLPFFICMGGMPGAGAGYLESKYAPVLVTDDMLKRPAKAGVEPSKTPAKSAKQMAELVRQLSDRDLPTRERARLQLEELGILALPHLRQALADKPELETQLRIDRLIDRIKTEQFAQSLNLDQEPLALRQSYGRDRFGQGCLAARRLVERGVPVVQVNLFGWDTHVDGFRTIKQRSGVLDAAWGALLGDLKERGLLDTTLIVWGGEFGRTPRITAQMGRDHWPHSFSVVLAGGGIKGGQVVGSTDRTGAKVAERPVTVPELMATICAALGIDPARRIPSTQGVLIPIVEDPGQPIQEILPAKAAK